MRRDQALFLGAGVVIGLIVGLLFGIVLSRPDLVGGVSSAPAPVAATAPGAPVPPPGQAAVMQQVLEAARTQPNNYEVQVAAGNILYDARRWSESEAAYKKALAIRADDANVITDLGHTLFQQGRNEEALQQFDAALRANPQQWQAAYNGVVVSLEMGDRSRAAAWLARLKQINPSHPGIADFERKIASPRS